MHWRGVLKILFSVVGMVLITILNGTEALAQDPFEIQVYEYETVPRGMWNLETHINYVSRGTRDVRGACGSHQQSISPHV